MYTIVMAKVVTTPTSTHTSRGDSPFLSGVISASFINNSLTHFSCPCLQP